MSVAPEHMPMAGRAGQNDGILCRIFSGPGGLGARRRK